MAVFRVERKTGYTVMSNHHLRNNELTLKAKGSLSQMLSLPEGWDYTLAGLSRINREKIDAIREAVKELEKEMCIRDSYESLLSFHSLHQLAELLQIDLLIQLLLYFVL